VITVDRAAHRYLQINQLEAAARAAEEAIE
jgi:hypothetical protein